MSLKNRLDEAGLEVVVLCGGPGGEREVSLASGANAYETLKAAGMPCRLEVVPEDNPDAFLEDLDYGVAVMMLHGEFGEDGRAQAILERRGIPFSGSDSRACSLAMDKSAVKNLCLAYGVPTARWLVSNEPERAVADCRERNLRFPLFVKPNFGGSSVGASRVDRPEQVPGAVEKALACGPLALLEEMVVGRELTVGWLDGRILPIVEMTAANEFYDYDAKYLSDATRYDCPANLPAAMADAVSRYAARVVEMVGARDVARVDVMLGADGPRVLELNALPGFTAHSLLPTAAAAAGLSTSAVCLALAGMAARRAGIL